MRKPQIGFTFESSAKRDFLAEVLSHLGVSACPLSPELQNATQINSMDGLLLSGGPDIDPRLYGQALQPFTGQTDYERDRLELSLLRCACPRQVPILGICRGMQMINVFLGGTLEQHIAHPEWHHHKFGNGQYSAVHTIAVDQNSRLFAMNRQTSMVVNSRHHQAVEQLGKGLRATATSDDGVFEALEHVRHPYLLGVQWHPEDRMNRNTLDTRILESFAAKARETEVEPMDPSRCRII